MNDAKPIGFYLDRALAKIRGRRLCAILDRVWGEETALLPTLIYANDWRWRAVYVLFWNWRFGLRWRSA